MTTKIVSESEFWLVMINNYIGNRQDANLNIKYLAVKSLIILAQVLYILNYSTARIKLCGIDIINVQSITHKHIQINQFFSSMRSRNHIKQTQI